MTLGQLYAIAASRGIEIDDVPMRELRAVSFPEGWIAVDRCKFASETEYKCVLAHEIGHCQTGSFYNIHSTRSERELCEHRANRFAAELLVPLADLKRMMHQGLLFAEILMQIFDVTLEFIRMVLELYEYELFAAARTRVSQHEITARAIYSLLPLINAHRPFRSD